MGLGINKKEAPVVLTLSQVVPRVIERVWRNWMDPDFLFSLGFVMAEMANFRWLVVICRYDP
jgi:hypothetical protein